MSDFIVIGQMVTEARNLLDSIKGGAIRAMQTTFDILVNTSKTQLDAFVGEQYGRVTSLLDNVRGELPHVLLTRNQVLETLNNSSIRGFDTLHCEAFTVTPEAIIYAAPKNDTDLTGNGVAADFRANVIGDSYVNKGFTILRVAFKRTNSAHLSRLDNFHARGNHQGAATGAAIVKLISGTLGGWPVELNHGNGWETRGAQAAANSRADNLQAGIGHYSINLGDNTIPNDEGEFLICLYGVVNGVVDFDRWGVFPELDKSWKV